MADNRVKAELILENGMKFSGLAFGYISESIGEVVFNTSMTGYEEILTDPSYAGQFIVMTYPLIGNYGINLDDMESAHPRLKGLIVREKCDYPSNWRCEMDLNGFLKQNKVVGLEGIDTRALTKAIRDNGTMKAIITLESSALSISEAKNKIENAEKCELVSKCSVSEKYVIDGTKGHIAFVDLGTKQGIIKDFKKRGFKITVFPAFCSAEEILESKAESVFFSNGPGNPQDVISIADTIKKLIGKIPVFGAGLGHLLIGAALGCEIKKMKFGHNGANYPVRDEKSKKIYITSQNHQYVLSSLSEETKATFTNINDNSIEGIKHKTLQVAGIQFQPEISPATLDFEFLFDRFLEVVERG